MPRGDKKDLSKLARAAGSGLITVEAAAGVLGVTPAAASARLTRLTCTGWATRVRRGLYLIPPLESQPGRDVSSEDPWVLAREVFSPCYIGGWSAAEYWGLTEQLFRTTLVVTSASVRRKDLTLLGADFRLFRVPASRLIDGVVSVWRGPERVPVSGQERTLVDCLNAPELSGGIRHLTHLLLEYALSEKRDFNRLLSVAEVLASGAAWKRLGFLSECLWPENTTVPAAAAKHRSAGNARLDPAVRQRGRLLKRWRLWVNVAIDEIATPSQHDR